MGTNAGTRTFDTEKFFLPGFTSKDDYSGLGLYNCRKLAERLMGKLEVRQEDGMAAFTLSTPPDSL